MLFITSLSSLISKLIFNPSGYSRIIRNAPYNDLCQPFRYFIPRRHARRKFIVHASVIAVRTRGHVALDQYDIHVNDIYRHIRLVLLSRIQHAIRRKSQQRANVVRFCKIYPIGAFDLTSHRIVVGANNQRELFILVLHIVRT